MAPSDPMALPEDDDEPIVGEVLDPSEAAAWLAESTPQCSAHSKTTGRRCQRSAIPGGMVCIYHGGSAPQVQRKAAERLAEVRDIALDALHERIVMTGEYLDPKLLLDTTVKLTDVVEKLAGVAAANDTDEESTDRSTEQLREDLYARFSQLDERRLSREQAAIESMEQQQRDREAAKVAKAEAKVTRIDRAEEATP